MKGTAAPPESPPTASPTAPPPSPPPSSAKCPIPDFPFAVVFVLLFLVCSGYGIAGLDELRSLSVCGQITPAPTTNALLLSAYSQCLSLAVRGRNDTGPRCTSFVVQKTVEVASTSLPPKLQPLYAAVEGAYEGCIVFVANKSDSAPERCLAWAVGLFAEVSAGTAPGGAAGSVGRRLGTGVKRRSGAVGAGRVLIDAQVAAEQARAVFSQCRALDPSNTTIADATKCITGGLSALGILPASSLATLTTACVSEAAEGVVVRL